LDCLSTLVDFFAVVDPANINLTAMWSQPGQQQQPGAAAAAAVGSQGDGNSSSSGGGGGDDSSVQRTLHLFVEEPWEVLDLTAPYSPVHDACRIAVWVGAPGSIWQQQQQPLAADGGGSQQQQQQQLAGLPGTPVPLSIDAVVQYILSAIDGYLDSAMPQQQQQQQQQQQSDALSTSNSSSSSSTGSDSGSNSSREADTVDSTKRLLLCGRIVSKWAGALAVKLYFEAVSQVEGIRNGSWASDQPPAPQDTAAAAEGGGGGEGVAGSEGKGGPAMLRQWLQQAAAVQAALLLTEIEGLYYGTMDILVQAVTQWEQQQQQQQEQQQQQSYQHLSGRQQQQQNGQQGEDHHQQQQNEREEREGLTGELYKNAARAQIIERVSQPHGYTTTIWLSDHSFSA
jgi:hypothetical protein